MRTDAPHIYVAHPMGKPPAFAENCQRAIDFGEEVYKLGALPKVPAHTVAWHERHPKDYEAWMAIDFAVIVRCDALCRMPGESPGADREVAFARAQKIPVLFSLDEVRDFVSAWVGRLGEDALKSKF